LCDGRSGGELPGDTLNRNDHVFVDSSEFLDPFPFASRIIHLEVRLDHHSQKGPVSLRHVFLIFTQLDGYNVAQMGTGVIYRRKEKSVICRTFPRPQTG